MEEKIVNTEELDTSGNSLISGNAMSIEETQAFQRLMHTYEERESIFAMREKEHQNQKQLLSDLLKQLNQEKEQVKQALEEQQQREEKLNQKEQMLTDWYQEERDARKVLDEDKAALEERRDALKAEKERFFREKKLQEEELRNERIKVEQEREMYEHRLHILELISEKEDGEEGKNAFSFFSALVRQPDMEETEYYQKEIECWKSQANELQEQVEELTKTLDLREKELRELKEQAAVENPDVEEGNTAECPDEEENAVADFSATEESHDVDSTDRKEHGMEDAGVEENGTERTGTPEPDVTAPMDVPLMAEDVRRFLYNEPEWYGFQIQLNQNAEELIAQKSGLDYRFLFTNPILVEISVERKNSFLLRKNIKQKNQEDNGAEFRYENGRVYAAMKFTDTVPLMVMLMQVEKISESFREGNGKDKNHEK